MFLNEKEVIDLLNNNTGIKTQKAMNQGIIARFVSFFKNENIPLSKADFFTK